jgi:putative oxidoreductase
MNLLQRLEYWGDRHHPKWADILRFGLGIFLCYKGIEFLENMGTLINQMRGFLPNSYFALSILGHYIVFAHLVGGLMLAFGFGTRVACILQIPILIGAIFFINSAEGMFHSYSQLIITVVCLLGLIYFLIVGNGPWAVSFDEKEDRRGRDLI